MKRILLSLAVLLAACKGSTGPQAVNPDPTVLVTNQTAQDTVWFNWAGSNLVGGVVGPILTGQSRCVQFNALPDSAYFTIRVPGPENVYPYWPSTKPPRFDPTAHPYWTVTVPDTVSVAAGAIVAVIQEVASAPC
jgi:hypothetical protein